MRIHGRDSEEEQKRRGEGSSEGTREETKAEDMQKGDRVEGTDERSQSRRGTPGSVGVGESSCQTKSNYVKVVLIC